MNENEIKLNDRDVLLKISGLIKEAKTAIVAALQEPDSWEDIEFAISDIRRYALVEIERVVLHNTGIKTSLVTQINLC